MFIFRIETVYFFIFQYGFISEDRTGKTMPKVYRKH